MAGTNVFGWASGGGGGGSGGTTNLVYVPTSGSTINLVPSNFNNSTIIGSTDSTGTTNFILPLPGTVTVGAVARIQAVGGNLINIVQSGTSAQLLDTTLISSGLIVNQPSYPSGNFTPSQLYGFYSDGSNWHTAQNS